MKAKHARELRRGIRYGRALSILLSERMTRGRYVAKRHAAMSDLQWAAAQHTILNHFNRDEKAPGLTAIPRTDGTVTIHVMPTPPRGPSGTSNRPRRKQA